MIEDFALCPSVRMEVNATPAWRPAVAGLFAILCGCGGGGDSKESSTTSSVSCDTPLLQCTRQLVSSGQCFTNYVSGVFHQTCQPATYRDVCTQRTTPCSTTTTTPPPSPPSIDSATLVIRAFIPGNYIYPFPLEFANPTGFGPNPLIQPVSGCGGYVVNKGDDRIGTDGKAQFSATADRFRVQQIVTVRRDGTISNNPTVHETKEYFWNALTDDGVLAAADDDKDAAGQPKLNDCDKLNRVKVASASGMTAARDLFLQLPISVAVTGSTSDPLVKLWGLIPAPAISWSLNFTVDFTKTPPTYKLTGQHDGFPAYEIYINGKPVGSPWDPGPPAGHLSIPGRNIFVYSRDQVNALWPTGPKVNVNSSGTVTSP